MSEICVVAAALSFAFGYALGRWDRHRSEEDMTTPAAHPTRRARFRAAYERWIPTFVLVTFFLSAIGIWIGVANIITNGRQDAADSAANKVRDEESAALLACFDDFATDLSGTLPPIRQASAARDDATGARDDALQDFVAVLVEAAEDPDPTSSVEGERLERFEEAITRLAESGEDLDRAQIALERARAANPYPPAPSTFCNPSAD